MSEASSSTSKNTSQRRSRLMGGLSAFFLVCGVLWFAYWLLVMRHNEGTDDAYVAGNLVRISAQVTGNVDAIFADNTQRVRVGQPLIQVNTTDADIALDHAKADLADAVRQTVNKMAISAQLEAEILLREVELEKVQGDYKRRKDRKTALAVSEEELSHAKDAVAIAQAQLQVTRHAWEAGQALVLRASIEEQPQVRLYAEKLREAWVARERCVVKSPVDGYVARRSVQVGGHVTPGQALMAVIPLAEVWVDANFKEGQLRKMRVGQPVTVWADLYGSSQVYTGAVAGFTPGTGSVFSLLPPENATGNWIKVVQRVPVKITLDAKQLEQFPLFLGLSCTVSVDVTNTDAPMLGSAASAVPVYQTDTLQLDMQACDALITGIINSNVNKQDQ